MGRYLGVWFKFALAVAASAIALFGCGGSPGGNSSGQVGLNNQAIVITVQPKSVSVVEGTDAVLTVDANINGSQNGLKYQWLKNGALITNEQNSSYTVNGVYGDSGAKYNVVVTDGNANSVMSAEAVITVTVKPVAIVEQPSSLDLTVGLSAIFKVQVDSIQPVTYQWLKDGLAIEGETKATFTIVSVNMLNNGSKYSVRVSNVGSSVTSDSATLAVSEIPTTPIFTKDIGGQVLVVNLLSTSLSVEVSSKSATTYQWYSDSVAIPGATGPSYTTPSLGASDDGRQYWVVATNDVGSTSSAVASIVIGIKPTITGNPQSQSIYTGQNGNLTVNVKGTSPLRFQWSVGGKDIPGATSDNYSTPAATLTDSGSQYSVKVTNAYGVATSSTATITVTAPPTGAAIQSEPVNAVARNGATGLFKVVAAGEAPLTYQWSKNGVDIPGARASIYQTGNVSMADDGSTYQVKVSNALGSALSKKAVLNVVANVIDVATGMFASFAVTDDGRVWGWGYGQTGQLGVPPAEVTTGVPIRVRVANGTAIGGATKVVAGAYHAMALDKDGALWSWGDGNYGALGDGIVGSHNVAYAQQVKDKSGAAFTGVSQMGAGYSVSVALKSVDGSVWTWGWNRSGRLGDGTLSNRAYPGQVTMATGGYLTGVSKISVNGDHVLALKSGKVYAWGDNFSGDLGIGTETRSGIAVKVETAPGVDLDGVVEIAAGVNHSVAITAEGKVYAWGGNQSGALGDGTTTKQLRAKLIYDGAGGLAKKVSAGQNTTFVVLESGSVLSFGDNAYGQQGAGAIGSTFQSTPKTVKENNAGVVLTGVSQVASTFNHVVARRTDGTVWAWGMDNSYQLGNPAKITSFQATPARVNGI